MGEVVELFPDDEAEVLPETCGGALHVFDEVPGPCRCGQETLPIVDDDVIGIREAERAWPDDFRGFGTNVKPRRAS